MPDKDQELQKFVEAVINDAEVRKDLDKGDYAAAFKQAGLPPPTDDQVKALTALGQDWSLLQALAKSFGYSKYIN